MLHSYSDVFGQPLSIYNDFLVTRKFYDLNIEKGLQECNNNKKVISTLKVGWQENVAHYQRPGPRRGQTQEPRSEAKVMLVSSA